MKLKFVLVFASVAIVTSLLPVTAAETLIPGKPVELPGTQGKFDFIKVDSAKGRLLLCHTKNGSLDVVDLKSSKLIKSIATGAAQGVAMDNKGGRYFVSVSNPPKLVIIDSEKLSVIGEVSLPDPADVLAYHPESNRVFVCDDEKPKLWVIDPEAKKILTTIALPGKGMEDLSFDNQGRYLFQNLKDSDEVAKIEPTNDKVLATWPTSPAEKPHGLAMVPGTHIVLIAGGTGKLVLLDLATGQILASSDISLRVDEIAYDPALRRAYCASGLGFISVVGVTSSTLKNFGSIGSAQGAHSIAVDPKTHTVWIAFARNGQAYIQSFAAK